MNSIHQKYPVLDPNKKLIDSQVYPITVNPQQQQTSQVNSNSFEQNQEQKSETDHNQQDQLLEGTVQAAQHPKFLKQVQAVKSKVQQYGFLLNRFSIALGVVSTLFFVISLFSMFKMTGKSQISRFQSGESANDPLSNSKIYGMTATSALISCFIWATVAFKSREGYKMSTKETGEVAKTGNKSMIILTSVVLVFGLYKIYYDMSLSSSIKQANYPMQDKIQKFNMKNDRRQLFSLSEFWEDKVDQAKEFLESFDKQKKDSQHNEQNNDEDKNIQIDEEQKTNEKLQDAEHDKWFCENFPRFCPRRNTQKNGENIEEEPSQIQSDKDYDWICEKDPSLCKLLKHANQRVNKLRIQDKQGFICHYFPRLCPPQTEEDKQLLQLLNNQLEFSEDVEETSEEIDEEFFDKKQPSQRRFGPLPNKKQRETKRKEEQGFGKKDRVKGRYHNRNKGRQETPAKRSQQNNNKNTHLQQQLSRGFSAQVNVGLVISSAILLISTVSFSVIFFAYKNAAVKFEMLKSIGNNPNARVASKSQAENLIKMLKGEDQVKDQKEQSNDQEKLLQQPVQEQPQMPSSSDGMMSSDQIEFLIQQRLMQQNQNASLSQAASNYMQ